MYPTLTVIPIEFVRQTVILHSSLGNVYGFEHLSSPRLYKRTHLFVQVIIQRPDLLSPQNLIECVTHSQKYIFCVSGKAIDVHSIVKA